MDKTAIETLIYRRQRLDAKYEQIKDLLSGSDKSFVELISTASGKYSKARINRLVDELVERLKDYRSYRKTFEQPFGSEMKPVTLSAKEQAFYKAYFRTMIGLALYNNDGPDGKMSPPGTWNALIERLTALPAYNEAAEIYRDIICYDKIGFLNDYPSRIPHGVIYDMWSAFETVTDEYFCDHISASGKKRAFELMTKEEADLIKKDEKSPGVIESIRNKEQEELDAAVQEFHEKLENGEIEPYVPEMDEFEEEYYLDNIPYYDRRENVKEWFAFFSDKEGFAKDCELILENIVDMVSHHGLREEAFNALQLYLAQSGVTRWFDDEYFTVYTYLNKAFKASGKAVERR